MTDITIRRPVEWVCSHDTNTGMVRSVNEDSVLAKTEMGLWAVADGMGGHEAGDVASNMLVRTLAEIDKQSHMSDLVDQIEDCIIDVNDRLLEYSEIMLDGKMVGSTLATLLICDRVGICMWVGDSRLYRYRDDMLHQISRDHSQVEELLQQGSITPEEASNHPDANVITRAVGSCNDIYVDVDVFDTRLGDTYILCSDGLYNSVTQDKIIAAIKMDNIDDAVGRLIELALQNGAPDNVSVILVKGIPGKPN